MFMATGQGCWELQFLVWEPLIQTNGEALVDRASVGHRSERVPASTFLKIFFNKLVFPGRQVHLETIAHFFLVWYGIHSSFR